MQGPINEDRSIDYNQRGIIPRTFEYLFQRIREEERKSNGTLTYFCKCTYVEIYNEYVYDLLEPIRGGNALSSSSSSTICTLREDSKKGVWVEGCREEIVHDAHEAFMLFEEGSRSRHVAETAMNRESSRSHCVFTITLQSKKLDGTIFDVREARFNLVDLAGSERQQLAATGGTRLKEAGNINKSLLALSNVINALVDIANGKSRHVHYRDSKLTFLLRDSLGGNSKTLIIAAVSPSPLCLAETLSTLRFAHRAKQIRNKAIVNKDVQGNIFELQAEVKRLRQENLILKSSGPSTSLMTASVCLSADTLEMDALDSNAFMWGMHYGRLRELQIQIETLTRQLESSQQLLERREDQLRNDRMILKFRDGTIQKYEKGLIKVVELNGDLVNQELVELLTHDRARFREELAALRDQVEKNPELLKYRSETVRLSDRIKSLGLLVGGGEVQLKQLTRFNDELYRKLAEAEEQIQRLYKSQRTDSEEIPLQSMSIDLTNNHQIKDHQMKDHDTGETCDSQAVIELRRQLQQVLGEKRDLEDRYEDLMEEMEISRNETQISGLLDNGTDYDESMSGGEESGKKRRTSDGSSSRESITVDLLKMRVEQLEAENVTLLDSLEAFKVQIHHQQHHSATQEGLFAEKCRELENLQMELCSMSEVKTQYGKLLQEHETLKATIEQNRTMMRALEMQIQKLSERLEPYEALSTYGFTEAADIAERLQRCTHMEHRVVELEFDLSTARHDGEDLLQQLQAIQETQPAEKLREAHEAVASLQNELDDVRGELVKAQQENEKLIQHRNIKQKLQYHVAIKEENNVFREEIRQLREDLTKLRQKNIELEELVQRYR